MSSAYRLTGRLESGELAELYEAVQEPEGSKVIIKLFHPKTSDPRYATQLARTYSVLNPLRSEGIAHVLDLGFVKQRLAVVRESVEGHGLGLALQRLNTKEVLLPSPVALWLIIQLLETVERAHAAGVVHGSITPGNVLLARTGLPYVYDFGALQALLEVPELKRAFAGRGRSAYRAPEVGRGEVPDALSDIYSLGAIAYELLTLREALVPDGGVSTRRAGLPPPSRLDRRLHARLDPILLRALEATPTRRYRSCGEFASALRNFLSTHGGLPGAEELRRFVGELFPNEVSVGTPGPVPFAERFSLSPISGAALAQVSAEPLEKSVVARPSFSPALSEADTMEAPPAFEEYQPEPTPTPGVSLPFDANVLSSTQIITPGSAADRDEETDVGASPLQEKVEVTHFGRRPGVPRKREPVVEPPPREDEDDASDDEPTWVAPPGAPPAKPRKVLIGGAAAREHTRIGRNPRLRVVEDFTQPEARLVDPVELGDTDRIEVTTTKGRTVPDGAVSRSKVTEGTVTRARVPEHTTTRGKVLPDEVSRSKVTEGTAGRVRLPPTPPEPAPRPPGGERTDIALPPPSLPEMPAVSPQRRLFTEERNLMADARRRRRMLFVAGAVALVALVIFVVAVWRFMRWPHFDTDPKVAAVNEAVDDYLNQPPPEARPKPRPPPATVPAPGPETADPAGSAWLSLDANLPARAYIDGTRVKHLLPLVRYPVKPGTREIVVETLGIPRQRKTFELRLQKGEHQKVNELFTPPPQR